MTLQSGADIAASRVDLRRDIELQAMMPDPRKLETVNGHGASVIDDATFRFLLDLETKKAQRLRYLVSLICLKIGGSETTPERLARLLASKIRATDCVTVRDEGSMMILLVDAEPRDLPSIVERVMTSLDGKAWSAGGASYPNTALAPDELLTQAATLQDRAEKDGGDRIYVATTV
jgi:hypothetical protein